MTDALLALRRLPDMREFCEKLYAEEDERKLDTLIGEAACFLEVYSNASEVQASRIESLEAEVERLKEGLGKIADVWTLPAVDMPEGRKWHCQHEEWLASATNEARSLLKEQGEGRQ